MKHSKKQIEDLISDIEGDLKESLGFIKEATTRDNNNEIMKIFFVRHDETDAEMAEGFTYIYNHKFLRDELTTVMDKYNDIVEYMTVNEEHLGQTQLDLVIKTYNSIKQLPEDL